MAQRFRKLPVEIEAVRYDGVNLDEVVEFTGIEHRPEQGDGRPFAIVTLEGTMLAQPGDWIIKGVQGEFYPCKPDIFEQTYEAA